MSKYNLSDAEYEIMQYIWKMEEEQSFQQIMAFTQQIGHTWKGQTVQTFLTRMIDKGVLQARKERRKRYYFAKETEVEWISSCTKAMVKIGRASCRERV